MRRAAAISLVVLAFYSARTLPQQIASTATIEGTVVRGDSGEPIAGAQVTLTSAPIAPLAGGGAFGGIVQSALAVPPPVGAVQPVTTGPDGKFVFKDLAAGSYRIAATANGFVRTEYGQRALNGQGRPAFVTAGQTLNGVVLRMTPTGTISGRVFDENGQAAIGAPVQLLRVLYSVLGKNLQTVGTGAADDRGDYRIYGVPPGRYYLAAGTPPGPIRPLGGPAGLGPMSGARYSVVFYPAAATFEDATTIELKAGREASFDMRVQRQSQGYRVRGRIIDATGNGLPANTNVSVAFRTFSGGGTFGTGRNFDTATGNFELQNIPTGDYTLQVQIPDPNPIRPTGPIDAATAASLQAAQAARPSGQTPVHVDKDLENIVITVSSGVTANGRFVLEGQPITALQSIQQLSLGFAQVSPLAPPVGTIPVGLPAQPDGTFQVVGLREGEYRIILRGNLTSGATTFYVKSIQYGGQDIDTLSKPFKFSGAGSGEFQVVLRSGPGQISGNITDNKSQPVAGIQVFAIPVDRNRIMEYRQAIADQNGHYSMTGMTPGDYQLFSWESIDSGANYDPDFLKAYEQQGKTVHVAESSSQNVDLRLIPAP
jgi:hypothetical protein